MQKFFSKSIFLFYIFGAVLLFFYSFTQIDLGLALTRFPALFSIQRAFQSIGYFNRPLSTWLYIGIVAFLFVCYFILLQQAQKKKLQRKQVWKYIFIVTGVLTLSYAAFSYDIFNYIFDAKIFTFYHQNPYLHKALDFPHDPMLGFMRWTHRTYPYGPIWLGITIPLSYIGLHIFLLTFFIFKLLAAGSFVGTVYLIEKIAEKTGSKNSLVPVVFFACNPLVLIETLVSGHNDIVMLFLALVSFYFLMRSKYLLSIVLLGLSIGTKFATGLLLPAYLSALVMQYMKIKIPWKYVWYTVLGCMGLAVIAASQKSGNFQPWYLLYLLPFVALLAENMVLSVVSGFVTFSILGTYVPYLYLGNWDPPVPGLLIGLYTTTAVIAVLSPMVYGFYRKKYTHR
jgi:hypothetical protein